MSALSTFRNPGATLRRAMLGAVLALAPIHGVAAQGADKVEQAWQALAADGTVLIMRHAIAPGTADPPGFRLGDCSTQRNLSDEGRSQAVRLGTLFREKGVRITRVISSPWCRTLDTAREMGFTEIEIDAALWNLVHRPPDRDAKVAAARDLIRKWRGPGVLLLSTHGETMRAVIGAPFYPPSGGSVVVQPDLASPLGFRVIGPLPPPE